MFACVKVPVAISVKRLLVSFLIITIPPGSTGAQEDPSNQLALFLNLESEWNEAHLRGDVETLDRLWAPELTVVVPEMPLFTKPDLMNLWQTVKVTFTRYETTDVQLRLFGQTAVVTGRLQRSRAFGDQIRDDDWLFTKTYALVDGKWKVVSYHASNRPANAQ